jgi:alpha-ribazole phosphatase
MELTVIRHTRLDIDAGRCYGQSEIELASTFDTELRHLKDQLSPPYSAIYSSPLQRCLHLARQFGDSIETDARLLEYDFGDWELSRWDDIDAAALDNWMQDFVNVSAPRGENLLQMYARVTAFMEALRGRDHPHCLIVTHSGVIRCIWAYLLQIPLAEIFKLEVGYGEVLRCRLAANRQEDIVFARG